MRFDIERCLNDAEISYEKISHKYKNQPCTKFALDHCFFDAAHINNDACIFQYENGNIAFKCFHESCKNKTWKDARNYLTEKGIKFEKYWPNKPINNTSIAGKRDISYLSFQEIYDNPVEIEPIVEGFIYKDDSTLIHAPGGVGKSMLAMYLALFLAAFNTNPEEPMDKIFDTFSVSKQRATLFIQAENSKTSMYTRITTMCIGIPALENRLNRLFVLSQYGDTTITGENFSDRAFCQYLVEKIIMIENERDLKIDLLIIDPLISYHGGNENDSVESRKTVDGITWVCSQAKCTPIVIHHGTKDGKNYRGSSAFFDWARSMISLKEEYGISVQDEKKVKLIRVTHEKCNNFQKFDSFLLEMDLNLNFKLAEGKLKSKDSDTCKNVAQVLAGIGGKADSKNTLAKAYKKKFGGSTSTAKRIVDKAAGNGFIRQETTMKDGKDTHEYFSLEN